MLVHATTVDIAGLGVLIFGESGAGKSDLALRLIGEGALLVADDQTDVEIVDARLRASTPKRIAGLIEARGVGVVRAPIKLATDLRLAVSLIAAEIERMPESRTWSLPGHAEPRIPLVELHAFEASSSEKVRRALISVPDA
jgi:serine kinase of HPr protein (carbohydrate metabolism regulator)